MTTRSVLLRGAAALVGGVLLLGIASTAAAAEFGDEDVDVNVEIAPLPGGGALSMSIAGTSATLSENGSTPTIRQFTGTLPTVTITDTRAADEIPDGAGWYVLGSVSDFTSASGDVIPAANLGWQPRVIDDGGTGLIAEGERVDTALDPTPDNVGLEDEELFAITNDSAGVAASGPFTANAELFLKTEPTVTAGGYSATLTLSLFE